MRFSVLVLLLAVIVRGMGMWQGEFDPLPRWVVIVAGIGVVLDYAVTWIVVDKRRLRRQDERVVDLVRALVIARGGEKRASEHVVMLRDAQGLKLADLKARHESRQAAARLQVKELSDELDVLKSRHAVILDEHEWLKERHESLRKSVVDRIVRSAHPRQTEAVSMFLQFKRLSETAKAPSKAYPGDAAYDLYADHDATVSEYEPVVVSTNVAVAIPQGYAGLLMGRSGLAKKAIHPAGFAFDGDDADGDGGGDGVPMRLAGVIDQYRGPLKVVLVSFGGSHEVKAGDAIAQLWILPVQQSEVRDVGDRDLPPSERGDKGFGSSDKRAPRERKVYLDELERELEARVEQATDAFMQAVATRDYEQFIISGIIPASVEGDTITPFAAQWGKDYREPDPKD